MYSRHPNLFDREDFFRVAAFFDLVFALLRADPLFPVPGGAPAPFAVRVLGAFVAFALAGGIYSLGILNACNGLKLVGKCSEQSSLRAFVVHESSSLSEIFFRSYS